MKVLKNIREIENIIIIDMKSADGTKDYLSGLTYDYIIFEESDAGGYAQAWNEVVRNFHMEDVIVFMKPQYLPGMDCFVQLAEVLQVSGIGAVGPVSNGFRVLQYLEIPETDDLKALYYIERQQQNKEITHKTMGLFSGLWAVKKTVLEDVGLFQADLMSPAHVLMDYQTRMILKGYQLVICRRAVAYDCFGGMIEDYDMIYGDQDLDVLRKKWKVNYLYFTPNIAIAGMIQEEREAEFKVLEVGCNLGATLLEIKNRYPNSKVYGMEINEAAVSIAGHVFEAAAGNIEEKQIPFEEEFDYIIFADVLEHLRIPQEVIGYCREKLCENGCIIASIPNIMNITVMEQMIRHGRFTYTNDGLLDRTHIHFFTFYEIVSMFQKEKYTIESTSYILSDLTSEQSDLIEKLIKLSENVEPYMYQAYQYLIKARKG